MRNIVHRWLARSRGPISGMCKDIRGAAITEFALVLVPFLTIILATFSLMLVFFAQQSLETVAEGSARIIMTGEAQTSGLSQSAFKAKACAMLPAFMSCSNLMVDVSTTTTFSNASTTAPTLTYGSGGGVSNSFSYNLGAAGDIVVLRLLYIWPIAAPNFGLSLTTTSNGNRVLVATSVAKSEQYH